MGFKANETKDHVHSGALEAPGPQNIIFLVKSGLKLNDHRDLLAQLCGRNEGVNDRAVTTTAVEGLLDGKDVWIVGCHLQKLDHGVKAVVGMVQKNIFSAHQGKEIFVTHHLHGKSWVKRRIFEVRDRQMVEGHKARNQQGLWGFVNFLGRDMKFLF